MGFRFGTCTIYKRKRVSAFIIDEIMIQIGNKHYWLRICIESIRRSSLEFIPLKHEIYLLYPHCWNFWLANMIGIPSIQIVLLATRSMQETGNKTLFAFSSGEEFDRKDYAVL